MNGSEPGLWQGRHLLAFGVLAMALSGFGQTFFIAVFGGELRAAFGLSHAAYGTLYSLATVTSAMLLLRAGAWVDRWPLARVTGLAVILLAAGCGVIGTAGHVALLALGFLLVRFAGQGLMAHIGLTVAARSFTARRGKAVAITAAGMPLAEAVLPATAVALTGLAGWRISWWLSAAILLALALPLLVNLARRPIPRGTPDANAEHAAGAVRSHTRAEALRDPGFYLLLPAALAAPFVVTAVLFHQVAIAEAQGWSLELVASAFIGFAGGHVLTLMAAGSVVDRIGAHRSLPLAVLPMGAGLACLALASGPWVAFVYLTLTGATVGAVAATSGALWAERYGTRHLGAIRSVAQATMVVSTAIAPVVLGLMLDLGWSVTAIGASLAIATGLAAGLATLAGAPAARAAGSRG